MASERDPQQIARRALILGAIAFRSSLEVTDHPRNVEVSRQLLPWLRDVGCGDELDPIERELLSTPVGQLSDGQRIDANWAGEAAGLFCWTLEFGEPLEEKTPVDPRTLPTVVCVLKPEAADVVQRASLRARSEIEAACRQFVLIRSMLQESRIGPPASNIIRHMHVQRLNDVGLVVTEDAISRASEALGRMTPQDRSRVAGLYFVRDHAALWFLSDRSRYFA